MRTLSLTVLTVALSATSTLAFSAPRYALTALETPSGHNSTAEAINNHGVIVGSYSPTPSGAYFAVRWNPDGSVSTNLAPVGVSGTIIRDISDNGWMAGNGSYNHDIYRWSPDGQVSWAGSDWGSAINSTGQIASTNYVNTGGNGTAMRRDPPNSGYILQGLGGDYSGAQDINDASQLAGTAQDANGDYHAVRWEADRSATDLGLGQASAINQQGVVAGLSTLNNGQRAATVWDGKGGKQILGTLGGDYAAAGDINEAGQVVGLSRRADGSSGAFLYDPTESTIFDLATLIGDLGPFASLIWANDINDHGQIVGYGILKAGGSRAFLANPVSEVPVPTAAWLFGSALLGLWGSRRQR